MSKSSQTISRKAIFLLTFAETQKCWSWKRHKQLKNILIIENKDCLVNKETHWEKWHIDINYYILLVFRIHNIHMIFPSDLSVGKSQCRQHQTSPIQLSTLLLSRNICIQQWVIRQKKTMGICYDFYFIQQWFM